MKAAQIEQYGDPSVIKISDIERPRAAAGQVLVEVHAASLNPFDTLVREGRMKDVMPLDLPVTLGGDIAGVVVEVGAEVDTVSPGDRVFGQTGATAGNSGAFAEYAVVSAAQVAKAPSHLDFTHLAAMPLVSVSAWQALTQHLEVQAGQKVFINGGAGGIGMVLWEYIRGFYYAETAAVMIIIIVSVSLLDVVSQRLRDEKGPNLAAQLLIYPVTRADGHKTQSMIDNAEGYFLETASMEYFIGHYLRSPADAQLPGVSPIFAKDFSNLPPTLVLTCEFDPLRDEGEDYGKKLQAAGVPVTYRCYEQLSHSFTAMSGTVPAAKEALEQLAQETKQALQS